MATNVARRLDEDVFFMNFGRDIEALARLAVPEVWGPADMPMRLLKTYINITYNKCAADGLIGHGRADKGAALRCFDTGLYTKKAKRIYGLLEENRRGGKPWFFVRWEKEVDIRTKKLTAPKRPLYHESVDQLVYDPDAFIDINGDWLLSVGDTMALVTKAMAAHKITGEPKAVFAEALKRVRTMVTTNSRLAVPVLFPPKHDIQLVVPLYISSDILLPPDMAISLIEREPTHDCPAGFVYGIAGIMTLEQAYSDARILGIVESGWLTAASAFGPAPSSSSIPAPASSSTLSVGTSQTADAVSKRLVDPSQSYAKAVAKPQPTEQALGPAPGTSAKKKSKRKAKRAGGHPAVPQSQPRTLAIGGVELKLPTAPAPAPALVTAETAAAATIVMVKEAGAETDLPVGSVSCGQAALLPQIPTPCPKETICPQEKPASDDQKPRAEMVTAAAHNPTPKFVVDEKAVGELVSALSGDIPGDKTVALLTAFQNFFVKASLAHTDS